ncbi:MAG TPA: chloride channel protein [Thermoanaerobaculia bacterium]|nr:chloride channel protein [Thermoanaerobaculia bacterium]
MSEPSRAPWRRLQERFRSFDFTLARRFGLATREERVFYFLIGATGVGVGVLGLAVGALTDLIQRLLWRDGRDLLDVATASPLWLRLAAPTAGGLLVGLVLWLGRSRVSGHGTSALIEAVALKGGRVEPKPVLLAAIAGVATVGSGGSLGREGPMVSLGSTISSWLGSRFGLPAQRVKILLGCGAAAGIAALYNTPIGGALFAMEVILGNFALEIFGPLVVSSVLSTIVVRSVKGNAPIYAVPEYSLVSARELIAYVGLGILGGIASVLFIQMARGSDRLFRALPFVPWPLKPALGMLGVGALGIYLPYVYGNGFETITLALHGRLPIALLVALPAAKLAATALTSGSGCAGGMFTPSLLVGALVGGGYGTLIHETWPAATASSGAYAAIGMAAIAAGTSHAPISAILIVFEFTGNYGLILPLMLASITASVVARKLYAPSIYTDSLESRGVDVTMRMEEAALAALKAEDLMRPDPDPLGSGDGYQTVVEKFLATRRQRLFVLDSERRLLGAISLHDIKHALESPETLTMVVAHDLMVPAGSVLHVDERLHHATEVFAVSEFERLPVLDAEERFAGILAKRDLLAVYAQEVLGRPSMLAKFVSSRDAQETRDYVELPPDFSLEMLAVPEALVGKTLAEAQLPKTWGVRVIEIRRRKPYGEEEHVIPAGETVLQAGDRLALVGPSAALERLEKGEAPIEVEAVP